MEELEAFGTDAAIGEARRGDKVEREPALRPDYADPENWHDLAERGTPRNG